MRRHKHRPGTHIRGGARARAGRNHNYGNSFRESGSDRVALIVGLNEPGTYISE
jgi:hypothetical protein